MNGKFIQKAQYIRDYCIMVTFEDGKVVTADFSDIIPRSANPLINQYKNTARLRDEMTVEPDCLDWNNDLTINAESIYDGLFTPPQYKDNNPCGG